VSSQDLEKEIRESAQVSKIEMTQKPEDEYDQKMWDTDKLRKAVISLPTGHVKLNVDQKNELEKS